MKRNVVACLYPIAALILMAACQDAPDAAKSLDPSGLRIIGDAINYNTNERDVYWSTGDKNPCNGDSVVITGSSHFVIHVGFDNLGGLHYSSNVVSRGDGVGIPSGKAYTIFDQEKFSDQAPANPDNFVIIDRQYMRVSGPTRADDYTTIFMDRVTVDHDGNPTTEVIKDSYKCS